MEDNTRQFKKGDKILIKHYIDGHESTGTYATVCENRGEHTGSKDIITVITDQTFGWIDPIAHGDHLLRWYLKPSIHSIKLLNGFSHPKLLNIKSND